MEDGSSPYDKAALCALMESQEGGTPLYGLYRDVPLDMQGMIFGLLVLKRDKLILCVCPKQGVYFVICPEKGPKLEGVVLHSVGILGLFLS